MGTTEDSLTFLREFAFTYSGVAILDWIHPQRRVATYQRQSVFVYGIVFTLITAFLLAVVTARGRRLTTLVVGGMAIVTTLVLGQLLTVPEWYVGWARLHCSYCMYMPHVLIKAELGLHVGLDHFNITLISDDFPKVYFNEEFNLPYGGHGGGSEEYRLDAIKRALPNPIVTVAEYMDSRGGNFNWNESFATAGYFARIILYFAVVSHVLQGVLLMLVPNHGLRCMAMTGALQISAGFIYSWNLPSPAFLIYVEGTPIEFQMGRCFVSVLVCGFLNLILGVLGLLVNKSRLEYTLSTFMELNYDTPWATKKLKADSEARREANLTQLFVDSRIRASVRRFRESLKRAPRSHSQDPKMSMDVEQSQPTQMVENPPGPTDNVDLIPQLSSGPPYGPGPRETLRVQSEPRSIPNRGRSFSEIQYTDEIRL
eukprot:maker-scaffold355_size198070-snap-gene-0.40 protein:Tk03304 transcript:maker-scaffold355_size198070-snap-gene-0.40-mRNA-1 annotation:"conserved hypothetical protein"